MYCVILLSLLIYWMKSNWHILTIIRAGCGACVIHVYALYVWIWVYWMNAGEYARIYYKNNKHINNTSDDDNNHKQQQNNRYYYYDSMWHPSGRYEQKITVASKNTHSANIERHFYCWVRILLIFGGAIRYDAIQTENIKWKREKINKIKLIQYKWSQKSKKKKKNGLTVA